MKLQWGKYKGSDIEDVPEEYLRSTIRWSEKNIQDCNAELERRAAIEDAERSMVDRVVSAGFRELAKRCHPDLHGGDGEEMKQLNAAVEMLRDMLRREVSPK